VYSNNNKTMPEENNNEGAKKAPDTLVDKQAEIFAKVESGDPSVAQITIIKDAFEKAVDKGNVRGLLGENLKKLQDVRANYTDPSKANQALDLMEAVYKQADLGKGGKYEVVVPADTPPDKKVEVGRNILQQDIDSLKSDLSDKHIEQLAIEQAGLELKANEVRGKLSKAGSRRQVRQLVTGLRDAQTDVRQDVQRAARLLGGRPLFEEVKKVYDAKPKFSEEPLPPVTDDEKTKGVEASSKAVIGALNVSDEVKARIDPKSEDFQNIAAKEREIAHKRTQLLGKDAVVKDGKVEDPGTAGAYLTNPEAASALDDEIRRLQIDKKALVGKVRLTAAEERVKLADEKLKEAGRKMVRSGGLLENLRRVVKPYTETKVARLSQVGEEVKASIAPQIDLLRDAIDKKADEVSFYVEPISGVFKTAGESIKKAAGTVQKVFTEQYALQDSVADSKAVKAVKKGIAGLEGQAKADKTEASRQIREGVYAADLAFKEGLRRVAWEAKMRVGAVIGGAEAQKIANEKFRRMEGHRQRIEDRIKVRHQSEIRSKSSEYHDKKLEERFKTAEASKPSTSGKESERSENPPIFKDKDVADYQIIRQTLPEDRGGKEEIWSLYREPDNTVYLQQVDMNGNRIGKKILQKDNIATEQEADAVMADLIDKGRENAKNKGYKGFDSGMSFSLDKDGKPVLVSVEDKKSTESDEDVKKRIDKVLEELEAEKRKKSGTEAPLAPKIEAGGTEKVQDKEKGPLVRDGEIIDNYYVTQIQVSGQPDKFKLFRMGEDTNNWTLTIEEVDEKGNLTGSVDKRVFQKDRNPKDISLRMMQRLNTEMRQKANKENPGNRVLTGLTFDNDPANDNRVLSQKDKGKIDSMYLDTLSPLGTQEPNSVPEDNKKEPVAKGGSVELGTIENTNWKDFKDRHQGVKKSEVKVITGDNGEKVNMFFWTDGKTIRAEQVSDDGNLISTDIYEVAVAEGENLDAKFATYRDEMLRNKVNVLDRSKDRKVKVDEDNYYFMPNADGSMRLEKSSGNATKPDASPRDKRKNANLSNKTVLSKPITTPIEAATPATTRKQSEEKPGIIKTTEQLMSEMTKLGRELSAVEKAASQESEENKRKELEGKKNELKQRHDEAIRAWTASVRSKKGE
jgi:hypothetical protein